VKILFAGPSLHGSDIDLHDIDLRPPAAHGDIAAALTGDVTAIGLVDGLFGSTAAVWHKELLYALSLGVRVLGASSMGALRAAECEAFGMEPVGVIADMYVKGELDDDAEVALGHLPPELHSAPLSEAKVDADATVDALRASELISAEEHDRLRASIAALHFAERTVEAMIGAAGLLQTRSAVVHELYLRHRVPLKRRDAELLVERLRALPNERGPRPAWIFNRSPTWQQLYPSL
jgi:hypothetical protein